MKIGKTILLCFLITFIMSGYGVAIPLGEYLHASKKETLLYVSLLFSLYSLGQLIAAPILGRIGDEFGRKKIIIITTIIYLVVFVGSLNVVDRNLILVLRFFTGMFAGATILSIESYIGEHTLPEKRIMYYTFTSLAIALGMILGPVLGVLLIINKKLVLLIYILIFIILILLLHKQLYSLELEGKHGKFIEEFIEAFALAMRNNKNIYVYCSFFMLGIISSSLESTGLAFLVDNRDVYILSELNILFVLVLIGLLIGYVLVGNVMLANKINKVKYSMVMIFITITGLLVMALSRNINILILGFIILILGLSSVASTMSTLITLNNDKNGMLLGIRNTILGIGSIIGPILSAFLYGMNMYFTFIVFSIMCGFVLLYAYIKKIYS